MCAYMHANVRALFTHACIHTDIQLIGVFPKKSSLSNFAFFMDNTMMWDLPCNCQRPITGGLVISMFRSPYKIILMQFWGLFVQRKWKKMHFCYFENDCHFGRLRSFERIFPDKVPLTPSNVPTIVGITKIDLEKSAKRCDVSIFIIKEK